MIPTGTLASCAAVLAGGILGSVLSKHVPDALKKQMPILFGFCAMGIGIRSLAGVGNMTAVILAVLSGFILGHICKLEAVTIRFFRWLVQKLHLAKGDVDMDTYITVVVLFCCSGFGWYAVMTEAISGDPQLLYAKAVLDFFTAVVFATLIGKAICAIPLVQVVVLLAVYGVTVLVSPWITPAMFANLSVCGGLLTLATSMRVAQIKSLPVIHLMPALILIFPATLLFG